MLVICAHCGAHNAISSRLCVKCRGFLSAKEMARAVGQGSTSNPSESPSSHGEAVSAGLREFPEQNAPPRNTKESNEERQAKTRKVDEIIKRRLAEMRLPELVQRSPAELGILRFIAVNICGVLLELIGTVVWLVWGTFWCIVMPYLVVKFFLGLFGVHV